MLAIFTKPSLLSMAATIKKQLALDANVPLDIADNHSGILEFHQEFLKRGYELWIAPTALLEIHVLSEKGDAREKSLALKALSNLLAWRITPFNLNSVGHGLTQIFAEKLITKGLLPEGECHDGMILAETALAEIPMLVTSDSHLLDIEETDLKIQFDECGLSHVFPVHPVRLLRALR